MSSSVSIAPPRRHAATATGGDDTTVLAVAAEGTWWAPVGEHAAATVEVEVVVRIVAGVVADGIRVATAAPLDDGHDEDDDGDDDVVACKEAAVETDFPAAATNAAAVGAGSCVVGAVRLAMVPRAGGRSTPTRGNAAAVSIGK
jgi:hypothetical protein